MPNDTPRRSSGNGVTAALSPTVRVAISLPRCRLPDWIYDALTPEQRVRYGDALAPGCGSSQTSGDPLKWGHWEYNQTWGRFT